MLQTDRAIIVFARTPGCEAKHKPLGDARRARHVHELLLGRLQRELAQVRTPADVLLVLDGSPAQRAVVAQRFSAALGRPVHSCVQSGGRFGDRIDAAVRAAAEQGARTVALIGADSPEMQASHIDAALARVEHGESVVGHSKDGGFWLAAAPVGALASLADLPWETRRIGRALAARLDAGMVLPVLADVDDLVDLGEVVRRLRAIDHHLARQLSALLSVPTRARALGESRAQGLLFVSSTGHRGPPARV